METNKLASKLLAFQKKITPIIKDATNPHFKNRYATLTNIISEVKPILSELGLVIMQPISGGEVQTVITDTETGEAITSSITLPTGLQPQALGSAITYYRRYTLASLLSLEIDDDDANATNPIINQSASVPQDDNRPWINDKAVDQAIERIKTGEAGVIEKCKSAFKISKANMEKLTKAMEGK